MKKSNSERSYQNSKPIIWVIKSIAMYSPGFLIITEVAIKRHGGKKFRDNIAFSVIFSLAGDNEVWWASPRKIFTVWKIVRWLDLLRFGLSKLSRGFWANPTIKKRGTILLCLWYISTGRTFTLFWNLEGSRYIYTARRVELAVKIEAPLSQGSLGSFNIENATSLFYFFSLSLSLSLSAIFPGHYMSRKRIYTSSIISLEAELFLISSVTKKPSTIVLGLSLTLLFRLSHTYIFKYVYIYIMSIKVYLYMYVNVYVSLSVCVCVCFHMRIYIHWTMII